MQPFSDTLSWFWANQSLHFLLNDVCLAEKQPVPIFGFTRSGLEPMIYHIWDKHANHYTTDAVRPILCVAMTFYTESKMHI